MTIYPKSRQFNQTYRKCFFGCWMKNWGYLMIKNNDIWGILGENRGLKDKILILGAKMAIRSL